MEFQVEQVSPIQKKLSFTVPSSDVSQELDKAFRNLQRRVRLPGFRPGKTPRRVLEQRFGASVSEEVASKLINTSFQEAASELEYFGQPALDRGPLKKGADFAFSITVEVRPELELAPYTGVEVVYPPVEVPEAQVEERIGARLQGQATISEVERDTVEQGDKVLCELTLSADGEVVHQHPGPLIDTGDERYYAGLQSHLVGLVRDQETEIAGVEFAADAELPEVAGKTLDAKVTITSIQALTVPELTDELAEELGWEGGRDGAYASERMKLEESANSQARNQARANLLSKLIEMNSFDAPAGLVEQQLKALLEEIRVQRAYFGQDRNWQPNDREMADYRERARFAAKSALILEHVSKAESLDVTDAELEAKYQEIADARGQRVEAIKGYFVKEGAVEDLRGRLLEEKTLDWLLERASLVDSDNDDASGEE